MKKSKGLTIIELVAGIVIIAIITFVGIPSIIGVVQNSSRNEFEYNAKKIIKAIEHQKTKETTLNLTDISLDYVKDYLGLDTNNYASLEVSINEKNNINVKINGQGKWEGYTLVGTYSGMVSG